MRKFLILCAALLCLSVVARAQDSGEATDAAGSAADAAADPAALPAAPASLIPANREPWQLGVGFEYQHYNVLGQQFHNLAFTADVTRYLNNWFGLEGTALSGYGSTPTVTTAKSLFLGGGAHISVLSTVHFEPWIHVLVGWERFRFTESNVLGNNSHAAFVAGGGLDYKIRGGRIYWRVQGDFMGTNMGKPAVSWSKNYFIGTGPVVNF
jgi:hypothetical protein